LTRLKQKDGSEITKLLAFDYLKEEDKSLGFYTPKGPQNRQYGTAPIDPRADFWYDHRERRRLPDAHLNQRENRHPPWWTYESLPLGVDEPDSVSIGERRERRSEMNVSASSSVLSAGRDVMDGGERGVGVTRSVQS